ncbi:MULTISPECIES: class I SAM-dependent methyltransferase [Paracoccus]|jgi:SAM-dependent methyltransferase|uniref:Methyltransferase domain-containing protein n=1 Tax=Paracoccus litorisediminis TaxID=2006130 RepID=A0A844HML7_9RHOB|nr:MULTISPECIES: methyltransferase domain-containing protein [Paracoccus]MBD9526763.1 methyltransferase domain-containing protein [Paracoccus sp. PAR01]MTH59664.1 methyltransferase domain-containing protein [Paracoccus litorisediminis]
MHHDVIELRKFYYNRALGRVVQKVLRDRLTQLWPPDKTAGMTLAGYGFAAPMQRPYLGRSRRVISLMPGPQGVMAWPPGMPNCAVLCEETAWPLDTGSVDRLILLHALETADHSQAVLAEAWRVLGPGGRMLVMATNRTGLWARSDATPFGFGRSYTVGQLEALGRSAGFVAETTGAALYIPPSDRRFWLRSAQMWERMGSRVSQVLVAGVVLGEFSKQMQAPIGRLRRLTVPSPLDLLEGIARPKPAGSGKIARGRGEPSHLHRAAVPEAGKPGSTDR